MPRYEKWLGASLGWIVTGNPLGGILGFLAGSFLTKNEGNETYKSASGISELEVNILVVASHLIKIDGKVTLEELDFTEKFFHTHFNPELDKQRLQVIHHCLQKEYDLTVACDQLRMYTQLPTRIQIIRFLLDLAQSDSGLNERENYFIFRVAGYLNVNDVEYRKLKAEHTASAESYLEILEVPESASIEEIRMSYRKLVLKYHPDRNKAASEADKKLLAEKFQQLKEAYETAKRKNGIS